MTGGSGPIGEQSGVRVLLCSVGARYCGLPLEHVSESMRPLPLEPLASAPSFVAGVSIVRGEPIPVLDLRRLLGSTSEPESPRRLVAIRVDSRGTGLLVDGVEGVRRVPSDTLRALPPLL